MAVVKAVLPDSVAKGAKVKVKLGTGPKPTASKGKK